MKIKMLGTNDDDLTGSMTLLQFPDKTQGLIDFGLTQFNNGNIASSMLYNGRSFDFNIEDVSFVVITHAHADHIGLLPLLIKRGFKGKIITTLATADFASISLYDTVKVFESDCRWYNNNHKNPIEPIYNELDVLKTLNTMRGYGFNQKIPITSNIFVELKSAGHMLGACMPKFTFTDKYQNSRSIIFTGDTSGLTTKKPFLPPADELGDVDYIVVESTYGDRARKKVDVELEVARAIQRTCIENKGTLLIPVFSLQRSSEMIWMLRDIYLKHSEFYKIPIYLDTPMGIAAQCVMNNNREYWGKRWLEEERVKGNIFEWDMVHEILEHRESQSLTSNKYPKIILSSSGMCEGGRIIHHLKSILPHKENEIMFSGHQVNGTIGHGILNTTRSAVGVQGDRIDIRCRVSQIPFSGHADKNQLTSLVKTATRGSIKHILINHGNIKSKHGLKKQLRQHIRGAKVSVPKKGVWYNI